MKQPAQQGRAPRKVKHEVLDLVTLSGIADMTANPPITGYGVKEWIRKGTWIDPAVSGPHGNLWHRSDVRSELHRRGRLKDGA
jgi:hypothetical protein